jgi:uncharacterized protein (UPF0332 family)
MSTGIPRAREELFAAHLLSTTGFAAQSVAHSVRAALGAAEAALLLLDRTPPAEPAAVVAAFVRHVVRERGLDPEAGRLLRSLFNRGVQADADGVVPQSEAPAAITDATAVVDTVEAWIDRSDRVALERSGAAPGTGPRTTNARADRRPGDGPGVTDPGPPR